MRFDTRGRCTRRGDDGLLVASPVRRGAPGEWQCARMLPAWSTRYFSLRGLIRPWRWWIRGSVVSFVGYCSVLGRLGAGRWRWPRYGHRARPVPRQTTDLADGRAYQLPAPRVPGQVGAKLNIRPDVVAKPRYFGQHPESRIGPALPCQPLPNRRAQKESRLPSGGRTRGAEAAWERPGGGVADAARWGGGGRRVR